MRQRQGPTSRRKKKSPRFRTRGPEATATVDMAVPDQAAEAVLKRSDPVPEDAIPVAGIDFNDYSGRNITVAEMVEKMSTMGFQATSVGQASRIINSMVC